MATATVAPPHIHIATDLYSARVDLEGYVSGVSAGSFVDKQTGAQDLGFGLDIVDFLLEPGPDNERYEPHRYHAGDPYHGNLPKRYVELPQICTQAKKLEYEVIEGEGFVAVRQWFRWTEATASRTPGSLWEQWLVFPDGKRYFYACDTVTSVNAVDDLILRIDLPGHLKHQNGDTFDRIYLSYHGEIPASEFVADFPPDARFLYQRGRQPMPDRMIRAYRTKRGPWLAGMTLCPEIVYEAWCHQRSYVCFIQEIGGVSVKAGDSFGAAYVLGWFDSIEEMHEVYDQHRGLRAVRAEAHGYELVRRSARGFEGATPECYTR
ncbi:MAG: hypothetical protein HY318_07940 [Armatimonadetes bacterium]|nr:hypothetical protein [Armatimonadota bacterium]